MTAGSGLCGRPLHKNCRCVRPAGHDGGCNCLYSGGAPGRDFGRDEPSSPDPALLLVAMAVLALLLVLAAIVVGADLADGGG